MKKMSFVATLKFLFILTGITAFTQNPADFTGLYLVEQRCWALLDNLPPYDTIYYSIDTTQYELEVNIAATDTVDLEVNLKLFPRSYTLNLNFINDSVFEIRDEIFEFEDYHSIEFFDSDGSFFNDSIHISFSAVIANSLVGNGCDCNGKKIRDIDVDIKEIELSNEFIKLYPNPVKNRLILLSKDQTYNSCKIYNLKGQLLQKANKPLIESIDVSVLSNGSYIIQFLKDEISIASGRFVKME